MLPPLFLFQGGTPEANTKKFIQILKTEHFNFLVVLRA